jgi:hypothetical protein
MLRLLLSVLLAIGFSGAVVTSDAAGNDKTPLWFLDDSSAAALWAPFGARDPDALALEDWVNRDESHGDLPLFRNTLSLNCWEYILYTQLRNGWLSIGDAKSVYAARATGRQLSAVLGQVVGSASYLIKDSKVVIQWPRDVLVGDVVFMDGSGHVVQLTGRRDGQQQREVVSFSPRPIWGDGSSERPLVGVRPELTTIESLIEEMIGLYPDVPTDWQNIDLEIVRISEQ